MPDKSWTEVMSEANKKVEELNNGYETECLRKKVSDCDVIRLRGWHRVRLSSHFQIKGSGVEPRRMR